MIETAIITTVRHNVGDDFVRDGVLYLLEKALGPLNVALIHKHLPVTVRREMDWFHTTGVSNKLDRIRPGLALRVATALDSLPILPATDRIRKCDLLIQSGAPVYWSNPDGCCSENEWWRPLIERRWNAMRGDKTFISLAGGTCQHYDSDGSEFIDRKPVLDFVRRFYDLTALTTVRDELSLEVLKHAGRSAIKLPCTSLFARNRLNIAPEEGKFIAINYMPGGGHFKFGQPILSDKWEQRFTKFIGRLIKSERCIMICHNEAEVAAACKVAKNVEMFYSDDYRDYLRLYAKAKIGIMNRVHGAFALASFGKPSVVIGADSRARMASMVGLESIFVNDATEDWLEAKVLELQARSKGYAIESYEMRERAEAKYLIALRTNVVPRMRRVAA